MYRTCAAAWLPVGALLVSLALAIADGSNTNIKLNPPKPIPSDATSVLDRALGSLSIELSCKSKLPNDQPWSQAITRDTRTFANFRRANMHNTDFSDFAGNLSHPNLLFAKAIDNIYQRTGQHPAIRPGGITADSSWFKADATLAIERDLSSVSPTWKSYSLFQKCDVPPDRRNLSVDTRTCMGMPN